MDKFTVIGGALLLVGYLGAPLTMEFMNTAIHSPNRKFSLLENGKIQTQPLTLGTVTTYDFAASIKTVSIPAPKYGLYSFSKTFGELSLDEQSSIASLQKDACHLAGNRSGYNKVCGGLENFSHS